MLRQLIVIGALLGSLPVPGGAQMSSDEEAIRRARRASNEAIARHDVPAILATLEPDFHIAVSTGDFRSGREEMGAAFGARFAEFDDAVYVRTTETVETSSSGPYAAETGEWVGSWTTPEGRFRTGGRYAAYWRKTGGAWLIHAELFVPLFCEGSGCG